MAQKYLVRLGGEIKEIEIDAGPQTTHIKIDEDWHEARLERVGTSSLFTLVIDNEPYELFVEERAGGYDLVIGFDMYSVEVYPARSETISQLRQLTERARAEAEGDWGVLSPMSGVVVDIYVTPGDSVQEGDVLLIIEAMKMNNELRAQRAGAVREIYVSKGQRVEQGTALLKLA
ncbi:MAG TPA: biotin/lipoyl-containing protein [Dehalococcoidia bacterium]|nr:biotin/lipoyl-containing protein [Dehalococcoidia bacterium]